MKRPPALIKRPDDKALRYAGIVNKDLIKFVFARDLINRAHFDAFLLHIDDEHRKAFMLRNVRISSGQHDTIVRKLCTGSPDLLAVDHPFIAILDGFSF